MRSALLGLLLLSLVGWVAHGVYSGRIVIPDEWNPWAPLRIDEPLNWLTGYKLSRVSREPALCMSVLSQAKMRYAPAPDRDGADGCGYTNAVRVSATSVAIGEGFTLTCRSAVSLAMWERHIVAPAAEKHFQRPVARVQHFGTYACRNIYGRKDAPLSRHATADAIDIAAFTLEGGRQIRVERDWGSTDADGLFLREVRDGACRVFDSVLGPEYNEAHRNHFHLDRGGYRVCR